MTAITANTDNIQIFRFDNNDGDRHNFFDGMIVRDRIIITKLTDESIQDLTEGFNQQNDYSQLEAPDFTVKLPRESAELSYFGFNLVEFLSHMKTSTYVVILKTGNRERSGVIDLDAFEDNPTWTEGDYDITFSCGDIINHFADYYKGKLVQKLPANSNIWFNEYWLAHHFTPSTLFRVVNQLAIDSRVPEFTDGVRTNPFLQRSIASRNAISQWDSLKETAQELGFALGMSLDAITFPSGLNGLRFKLEMYWRTVGRGTSEVKVIGRVNKYTTQFAKKWFMLKYRTAHQQVKRDTGEIVFESDMSMGLLMSRNKTFNFDNRNYTNEERRFDKNISGTFVSGSAPNSYIVRNGSEVLQVPDADILDITPANYDCDIFPPKIGYEKLVGSLQEDNTSNKITYARIFMKSWTVTYNPISPSQIIYYDDLGFYELVNATAKVEYAFLIQGVSSMVKLRAELKDDST